MNEEEASQILTQTINWSRNEISLVSSAYRKPWPNISSRDVRATLGKWMTTSVRHLVAITILSEESDLIMVGEVHHRQMFEILLQVRWFLMEDPSQREYLGQKISAWGCIDYLEKLKPYKDYEFCKKGYQEVTDLLSTFDDELIMNIGRERHKHNKYWFGKSFSQLGKNVSRDKEDLSSAYNLISADVHGTWDLTIGVANPEPGLLDFRGYPDKYTLIKWTVDLIDKATQLYVNTWNDIAKVVGAPTVDL